MWFSIPINATTIGLAILFTGVAVISKDEKGRHAITGTGLIGLCLMIMGVSVIGGGIINSIL